MPLSLLSPAIPSKSGVFRHPLSVCLIPLVALVLSCAQIEPFDSVSFVQERLTTESGLSNAEAQRVEVPFDLPLEVKEELAPLLSKNGSKRFRAERAQDYILHELPLRYSLRPTRDAVSTLRAKEGNCLSYAHLFIAITREQGLNSFYVEVHDRQRFVYRDRSVISQGHIAAGLRFGDTPTLQEGISLYEHLPYRAPGAQPTYRRRREIDDLTATAHHYNNLGAEALLDGNLTRAEELLRLATKVDPTFVSGLSNLGICLTRQERLEEAIEIYSQGLQVEPDNPILISNLARAHQLAGNLGEADLLLAQLEEIDHANPFFYVYRGYQALDQGEMTLALDYMREAFKRSTKIPEVHLGLAEVYFALGNLESARFHSQRALRLDATHEEARRFAVMLAPGRRPAPASKPATVPEKEKP